ncbi:ATP-grasp domain-containing protein [Stigmatella erecta]|uniref:ATP-grasp domain-containing protein n=1 Tax=Stigmatella erecta TaxID=83460 RepID=A0A1I0L8P9_9BACT|nr:ATP-grasp domain-containing protein [Stigmatella erecta]SEU35756.1 ATP-grasp domain-containing protein [Stigmatella erecta]
MAANIILLGAKRFISERAWQLGARPWIIQHPERAEDWVNRQSERVLLMDYEDPALIPMLKAAHAVTPFTSAITIAEEALLPCARINQALGLPGTPLELVEKTRDKPSMRRVLDSGGFSPVQWAAVKVPADAAAFAGRVGYPFILKPVDGVGSIGVRLVHGAQELEGVLNGKSAWIAEEYLDGPEYSVECFSFGGRHVILGINVETKNPDPTGSAFLEVAHQVPAPMSPERDREVRAFIRGFLDVLGLKDGPTHTELKYTAKGPRIVETHTRLGGDRLWDLVRLTTGYDLVDMTLQWAMGTLKPLEADPLPQGGAAIQYFTPPPGRLKRLHGMQALRRIPGVVDISLMVDVGATIRPAMQSEDRAGFVIAQGPTAVQALEICQEVRQRLVFDTV